MPAMRTNDHAPGMISSVADSTFVESWLDDLRKAGLKE
jgi:hypothetical protein